MMSRRIQVAFAVKLDGTPASDDKLLARLFVVVEKIGSSDAVITNWLSKLPN